MLEKSPISFPLFVGRWVSINCSSKSLLNSSVLFSCGITPDSQSSSFGRNSVYFAVWSDNCVFAVLVAASFVSLARCYLLSQAFFGFSSYSHCFLTLVLIWTRFRSLVQPRKWFPLSTPTSQTWSVRNSCEPRCKRAAQVMAALSPRLSRSVFASRTTKQR